MPRKKKKRPQNRESQTLGVFHSPTLLFRAQTMTGTGDVEENAGIRNYHMSNSSKGLIRTDCHAYFVGPARSTASNHNTDKPAWKTVFNTPAGERKNVVRSEVVKQPRRAIHEESVLHIFVSKSVKQRRGWSQTSPCALRVGRASNWQAATMAVSTFKMVCP